MAQEQKQVKVGSVCFGNHLPFVLIAGPCALESREHAMDMCGSLKEMTDRLGIGFVYKTSFDKANRTSGKAFRGIGMDQGLKIFEEIKSHFGCPLVTDVHAAEQCAPVASIVDILQIPAFLCRQTDLLEAAARTGKAVHIKKGQFLAPWDMANVAQKMVQFGCENLLLCERGASFGYNRLVSDMCSLPIMAQTGFPVVFDATHSVQQPGGGGACTTGNREFVPVLARAAVSIGVAGVFMETHKNPDQAPSDGPNMIPFQELESLLKILIELDHLAKQHPVQLS